MKRLGLIGIFMFATACRTAAPAPANEPVPPPAAPSAFEAAEAAVPGGWVERMHADGTEYIALLAAGDGAYELVRLSRESGKWVIVDRKPAGEDYLWPAQ